MREHAKLVDLITSSRRPTVITRTSGCIHQQRLVDARGSEGRYTIAIEEEVSRVPRNEFEPSTDSPWPKCSEWTKGISALIKSTRWIEKRSEKVLTYSECQMFSNPMWTFEKSIQITLHIVPMKHFDIAHFWRNILLSLHWIFHSVEPDSSFMISYNGKKKYGMILIILK